MEEDDANILLPSDNADSVQGRKEKWRVTIEPALLFLFFGHTLADSIIANQLLEQTCLNFGYNDTDCLGLVIGNTTKEIEDSIQPHVAEILMTMTLINSIIPAVLSLFYGPWSDKHGRKKIIQATIFGWAFTLLLDCAIAFYSTTVPMIDTRLYILAYIPRVITGGWPTMMAVCLCFITDLTTKETRSFRMLIIDMFVLAGLLVGTGSSSFILKSTSPTIVFLIGTISAFIAAFYVVFFVEESVAVEDASGCQQVKELVTFSPVVEMVKTCFKKRPNNRRRFIWCLIAILMISIFCMNGTSSVVYLFVREKFGWSLEDFTLFNSATITFTSIGSLFGMKILKDYYGFTDMFLATLAIVSMFVDSLMRVVAQTTIQMYSASAICMFTFLSAPVCRTLISSAIDSNEVGKIFSITSSFEAVSSLISAPLYTFVYEKTFTFFPAAFFLISAAAYSINIILIYCVNRMKPTTPDSSTYAPIDNS